MSGVEKMFAAMFSSDTVNSTSYRARVCVPLLLRVAHVEELVEVNKSSVLGGQFVNESF